jgi:hypothetical protein
MEDDISDSPEFMDLPEEDQLVQFRAKQPSFDAYYKADPEGALSLMREKTGKSDETKSTVGAVIRQFGSGIGESVMDTAALPFDAAEFVASKVGSDWSTSVDDSIEEYKREKFPEPGTAEGRVARSAGYWTGIGLQTYMTGGALGYAGKFPVKGAGGLAKAGKFISGGAKVEVGAGISGGTAEGLVGEMIDDDNPAKPWLKIGAGILAGGATGIAIASRGAAKRTRAMKSGEQPASPGGDVPSSSPESVKLDAADEATTAEIKEILGQDTLGRGMKFEEFTAAQEASGRAAMKGWTGDVYGVLKPARVAEIANGVAEVMNRTGRTYDPGRGTFMKHIADTIQSGDTNRVEVDGILKNFNTSIAQLADTEFPFQATGRTAGQTLGALSAASKKVRKDLLEKMSPEELQVLRALEPNLEGLGIWKRLENVRRGLLVTQVATAMRNMETQVANIGIHGLEDAMEAGIMKTLGNFGGAKGKAIAAAHPTNAMGTIMRIGEMLLPGKSRSFQEVEALKGVFGRVDAPVGDQALLNPLTASFSSDIMIGPSLDNMGALEKATIWLNSANRLQEFGIRRAVFTSELDRLLSAKNQSLSKIIDHGMIDTLDRGDVKAAVNKALETTWGEEFLSNMDGAKGMAGAAIQAVNKIGFGPLRATQVIPFPRFMANSVKWQYQHSPLPMMKMLVSPDDWKRMAAGDIKPIIKATTGTGLFMSAYQLRNSEYAGEKWYEVRPSDDVNRFLKEAPGSTYDMRPYNPFASFLFAADLMKRAQGGEAPPMTTRDIAMGFMSVNLRAGAGMYVLDQFLDTMGSAAAGIDNPEASFSEAMVQGGAEYLGSSWAGMLVPFQQLKDIARSFDDMNGTDNSTVRDTTDAPLAGQMARKLPGADENLPPVELPTREAAPKTGGPLKRQLLGLTVRGPKNPVEKELDRLGFSRSNILPSTGNSKWDTMRAKHMGPIVEQHLPKLVESDYYKKANNEEKFVALEMGVARARSAATAAARAEDPELAYKINQGSKKKSLKRLARKRARDVMERRAAMEELRTSR